MAFVDKFSKFGSQIQIMFFNILDVVEAEEDISAPTGCPNKINPYHECTEYCYEKYGEPRKVPNTFMCRHDVTTICL